MIDIVKVKQSYEYFSRIWLNNPKFKYKSTAIETKILNKFLKKNISNDYVDIFYYFCFQLNYWADKNFTNEKVKGLPDISWLFGDKAINRWLIKNNHWLYFVQLNLFKKYKFILEDFKNIFEKKELFYLNNEDKIEKIRDVHRFKFLNKPNGFVYCLENTSLIIPDNLICLQCNFKDNCKIALGRLFPLLCKKRYD
jgi:hypothetical protein